MKINKLKKQYEIIVNEYIEKFCNKHKLIFEFWVGNEIAGIACFGDIYFFNFHDIVYDINSKQPKNQIIDWIYDSVDNPEKSINYYSYSKGLRFNDLN